MIGKMVKKKEKWQEPVEDRRKRRVTFEEMAKRMLGYLRKKQVFP